MAAVVYSLIGLVLLVAAWVVWRITSVGRGARQRDRRILDELADLDRALGAGRTVSVAEVATLADRPWLRGFLHVLLEHHGRLDLFPERYLDLKSAAETRLTYWMMHPNELQAPPEVIEHVTTVRRTLGTEEASFYVFRYRMAEGHWAGTDWILGLGGPSFADTKPYDGNMAGWSLAHEKAEQFAPDQVVDNYVKMLEAKGVASRTS